LNSKPRNDLEISLNRDAARSSLRADLLATATIHRFLAEGVQRFEGHVGRKRFPVLNLAQRIDQN
jgi:hypothetical protein